MKSASGSAPVHKWRLSRTLRREVDYRPIENDDVKYAWAAYKKGGLAEMGFEKDLSPEQFKEAFERAVVSNCHAAWILRATTKNGLTPVGIVLGSWGPGGNYIVIVGMAWFPWVSKRNIVECMVGFLNKIRKEIPLQFYALREHKKLYEVCAIHSIVRRIGTSYTAIPGTWCAVFETRVG